jgi:ribosomal protein L36
MASTHGCGRSSVVEHQLPKLSVEGSIPFARSNLRCEAAKVVRRSLGEGGLLRSFGWQANLRCEAAKIVRRSLGEGVHGFAASVGGPTKSKSDTR